ncbi:putative ammonium transporter 1 [Liolophura sinensis]|uniref:putative ammonium transporter 1 n=1 Tax=Liolophura sinensis TaxID=3198878 RepID=UPI0031588394
MQCGFAFLEAGAVRSKNSTNILIKNLLDVFVAGIAYWIFGYAFAFGDKGNAFIGFSNFASSWMEETNFAFMFFQYVFAATAATIVSGAVAERCHFVAYLVYSFVLTFFIYPVVTHWAWSDFGWLKIGEMYYFNGTETQVGYTDFAGSGVVHVVGGTAAFVAAVLLGPRIGRFEDGKIIYIRGHSVPLAALGGFILMFGFLAFNGGSQARISEYEDGIKVATAVKNTIISGSFSAIVTLTVNKIIGNSRWSLLLTINGALAGMVAICAGCDAVYPWSAAIIGTVAAFSFKFFAWAVPKLHIDDPLEAVAVHFGGGLWGVIAVAFFHTGNGIIYSGSAQSFMGLAWQLAGLAAIVGWTGVLCLIMFGILKAFNLLRVTEDMERKGLDIPKHGEPAYPLESYGHGWVEQIIMERLASGDLPEPEGYLYPNIHSENGTANGITNKAYEVDVQDKGSYETPETVMHSNPAGRIKRTESSDNLESVSTSM